MAPKDRRPVMENEGEGSRSADLDYRERQAEFDETHDAEKLAADAERDVREHPDEYRRAEEEGRRHSKVDEHEK
jgi:hypothetical protein